MRRTLHRYVYLSFSYIGGFLNNIYHTVHPNSQGDWLDLSFPIPPLHETQMPCETWRDVPTGRDKLSCAKQKETKKSLNAAGSAAGDSFRQQGCSSVAARTHMRSLATCWSCAVWSLHTWKATESTQGMVLCAGGVWLTTKQNIHWEEAKHWGGDVKCTDFFFYFYVFTQSQLSLAPPNPSPFSKGGKKSSAATRIFS